MIIELPDIVAGETPLNEQELRLVIAIWLFVEKGWSLGRSSGSYPTGYQGIQIQPGRGK